MRCIILTLSNLKTLKLGIDNPLKTFYNQSVIKNNILGGLVMNKNVQNYLAERENNNTANNDEIKTISAQLNRVYTQITNGTRATAQKRDSVTPN